MNLDNSCPGPHYADCIKQNHPTSPSSIEKVMEEFDQKLGAHAPEIAFKNWDKVDEARDWLHSKLHQVHNQAVEECIEALPKELENQDESDMTHEEGWNGCIDSAQSSLTKLKV